MLTRPFPKHLKQREINSRKKSGPLYTKINHEWVKFSIATRIHIRGIA